MGGNGLTTGFSLRKWKSLFTLGQLSHPTQSVTFSLNRRGKQSSLLSQSERHRAHDGAEEGELRHEQAEADCGMR